jgi:hypothetical protein
MIGSTDAQIAGCAWCGDPVLLAFAAAVPAFDAEGERVFHLHETCLIVGHTGTLT